MARIRVFDPACGSGNFLVIAYKEMRAIEAEINRRRSEADRRTEVPLTNFRGIELRDFPAAIARLALIIAEYQCDVLYRGQKEALAEFLPLDAENWITCGNALRLDWLSICPPTGTGVKHQADDLFHTPRDQGQIDFENEGGETYICGNPPYAGLSSQTAEQKDDLENLFELRSEYWKSFDYVMGWFWKASLFMRGQKARAAFVATNSVCQGQLVPMFWPIILSGGMSIFFAYSSFKWRNLAANNAGVTVVIIGLSDAWEKPARLFEPAGGEKVIETIVPVINAYIVSGPRLYIEPIAKSPPDRPSMSGEISQRTGEIFYSPPVRRERLSKRRLRPRSSCGLISVRRNLSRVLPGFAFGWRISLGIARMRFRVLRSDSMQSRSFERAVGLRRRDLLQNILTDSDRFRGSLETAPLSFQSIPVSPDPISQLAYCR
jgi:hypothetical protein